MLYLYTRGAKKSVETLKEGDTVWCCYSGWFKSNLARAITNGWLTLYRSWQHPRKVVEMYFRWCMKNQTGGLSPSRPMHAWAGSGLSLSLLMGSSKRQRTQWSSLNDLCIVTGMFSFQPFSWTAKSFQVHHGNVYKGLTVIIHEVFTSLLVDMLFESLASMKWGCFTSMTYNNFVFFTGLYYLYVILVFAFFVLSNFPYELCACTLAVNLCPRIISISYCGDSVQELQLKCSSIRLGSGRTW